MMAKLMTTMIQGKVSGQASTWTAVTNRLINASGRRNFHARAISWSMRTRGRVVLVQTMTKKTRMTLTMNHSHGGSRGPRQPPRNRVVMMADMAMASAYSTR